ncbi:MAG: branched-chain amino acid ABC transporter permease [Acidimicrobiales bacterium]
MTVFTNAIGFGLVTAAILSLSAVALSLQYGVTNIPNFSHGAFLTVAAYTAYMMQKVTSNLFVDALIGGLVGALLGYVINRFVIRSFNRQGTRLVIVFIVTIGISIIVQNTIALFFGNQAQALHLPIEKARHLGPFVWTGPEIIIMLVALGFMALTHALLRYTKFGKAQRAVSDDVSLAQVAGINAERIVSITWMLAGFMAGISGVVLAVDTGSFVPTTGFFFLLPTFAVVIVGGIGSAYGAMVGSLIIGLATEIAAPYINASYKEVIAFGILAAFLLLRPQGIFKTSEGRAQLQ